MMTNLFNSFDPVTIHKLELNWLVMIFPIVMIPSTFWFTPSRHSTLTKITSIKISNEISLLMKSSKKETILFTSLFMTILFLNLPGLIPYSFTSTTHMPISISLALPLWMFPLIFLIFKKNQKMFSHLIPQGTPPFLMPFMVLIETVSNLIRPITLSVRLTANMIAGHLLITLLGNQGPNMNKPMIPILIISMMALLILETAVAIIQSYVFSILSTLYMSESM